MPPSDHSIPAVSGSDDFASALSRLLTPEGMTLLDSLGPYQKNNTLSTITRLRAEGFDRELVSAALTQSRLRSEATTKFGEFAAHMLFTQTGLEQATRMRVSAMHAQRFMAASVTSVADLGCGIGADSMAMAGLGLTVVAVEKDPTTAAVATVNLMPFPNAQVVCQDVESLDLHQLPGGHPDALWLDPARRVQNNSNPTASQRIFDPESFSPPFSFVEKLAATGIPMGVKMGPGLAHDAIPKQCEAQWVYHQGDVVEVVLWFNALARPGVRRSALIIDDATGYHELHSGTDFPPSAIGKSLTLEDAVSVEPGCLIWEPHGAVIRAGLVQELGEKLGARPIHPSIAYLIAPRPTSHEQNHRTCAFGKAYRVQQVLPHTTKVLKSWVKNHDIGTLEIKKRGTDITPEHLRRQLRPTGSQHATFMVTRMATDNGERRVVLVVEPLSV